MKKILSCILSLAAVLSLCACAGEESASIGVIGGADGPTSILVTEPDEFLSFDPMDEEEIGVIGSADGFTTIITVPDTDFSESFSDSSTDYSETVLTPSYEETDTELGYVPLEDEYYYDLESVVLYLEYYDTLPDNYITKDEARNLGWNGGSVERYLDDAAIGGDRFGNREGLLPKEKGRTYTECDLNTLDESSRGAERLVFSNDGLYFYTDDHYETFTEVWVVDGEVFGIIGSADGPSSISVDKAG